MCGCARALAGVPGLAGVRGWPRAGRRDRSGRGSRRLASHVPAGARRHQGRRQRTTSPHLEARQALTISHSLDLYQQNLCLKNMILNY